MIRKRKKKKKTRKKRKDMTQLERFRYDVRRRMLAGLLVVVPIGITIFALNFLYKMTAGILTPIVKAVLSQLPEMDVLPNTVVVVISVLVFVGLLYVTGIIAGAVIGRRLIDFTEMLIRKIPFVKTIYTASKQVVQAMSMEDRTDSFSSVVVVKWPHPGMRTLGFVTGTLLDENDKEYFKVFMPTTPNPTTGYFFIVAPEEVVELDIDVEEAAKIYLSLGILSPDRMNLIAPVDSATSMDEYEDSDAIDEDEE